MTDDGDVLEVERRVDLVHHVEGGGAVVVEGEDESQRAERLLAPGQVRDALPRLVQWAHAASRTRVEIRNEYHLRVSIREIRRGWQPIDAASPGGLLWPSPEDDDASPLPLT